MASPTRQQIWMFMQDIANHMELEGKDVLDIGNAGNPSEGENREWFGAKARSYKTLDKLESTNPDIVADICDSKLASESFDVIILSQTLEHIYTPKKAIKEVARLLKKDGFLIVDSPWIGTDYHPEQGFDDYYRYTASCLIKMCQDAGLEIKDAKQTQLLSIVVAKK